MSNVLNIATHTDFKIVDRDKISIYYDYIDKERDTKIVTVTRQEAIWIADDDYWHTDATVYQLLFKHEDTGQRLYPLHDPRDEIDRPWSGRDEIIGLSPVEDERYVEARERMWAELRKRHAGAFS